MVMIFVRSVFLVFISFGAMSLHAPSALANSCISLLQGGISFDVSECTQLDMENLRFAKDSRIESLKGLDAKARAQILSQYKGQMLEGKVVASEVYDKQFPKSKGLLNGEKVKIYLFPGEKLSCNELDGARLEAKLQQICCNGRLEAPCLLETDYVFESPKVVGKSGTRAGNEKREASVKSKSYVQGMQGFQKKNYKVAAQHLEKARAEGNIDLAGRFALGVSYRNLDICSKAIPVLRESYDEFLEKKNWTDQDAITRKAIFLLARCYAKEQDPGQAVLILNGYLIEPQKYKAEIKQSMRHPDFGWIHTSKEYKTYKKEATAKLR